METEKENTINADTKKESKLKFIVGFRSNKLWKKIIACIYYIPFLLMICFAQFYDKFIAAFTVVIPFVVFYWCSYIKHKNKKLLAISIACSVLLILPIIGVSTLTTHYYNKANFAYEQGNYENAVKYYKLAHDYNDTSEKLILAEKGMHYTYGVKAFEEKDNEKAVNELILAADFPNTYDKLEEVAMSALTDKQYEIAINAFNSIPDLQDEKYKSYAMAMLAFTQEKYTEAIDNFLKTDVYDTADILTQAYYQRGVYEFTQAQYDKAREDLTKTNGYNDTQDYLDKCNVMVAENLWGKGSYDEAQALYELLPQGFEYEGVNVADRLSVLSLYNNVKHLAGTYTVEKGDYKVTQRHRSTGIYHYWYNTEKGYGSLKITVKINSDNTVNISGTASGTRYTSYSVISDGVKEGSFSKTFSKDISSGSLPTGNLAGDDYTILKYLGGNKFSLTYNEVDTSQDVYFTYTYTASYTFSK